MKKNKSFKRVSRQIFWCYPLLLIGLVAFFSAKWYIETYGQLGFAAVLFTMRNNLSGTQSGLILAYLRGGLLPALAWSAILGFLLFFRSRLSVNLTFFRKWKLRIYPVRSWFSGMVSIVLCLAMIYQAADIFGIIEYMASSMNTTTLYEDEYVFPEDVSIEFLEEKRNLIYIILESAEVTFLPEEQGGALKNEIIPEMYDLAKNNINFSDNADVGGDYSLQGSVWTMGALVAQTAGIPLKVPVTVSDENSYGLNGEAFLPGVTSINDILCEYGYNQALMVGSDGSFGGRAQYFAQHGVNKIYDLYTAYEDGIVPQDYYVWWGFEDMYLYEYARQEITEMAAGDQPFAFTMLTVDTHHVDGYKCELCGDAFSQQYENVFSCASRQLNEFITWIQQQDFYENTTIVITGDHPTMDAAFIAANVDESYPRRVYNCFINSAAQPVNSKNRLFSTMDMFPTTLAAMGCRIEGDRLGLGVNLFSDQQTLMERMDHAQLNADLASDSPFYTCIFLEGYEYD